MKKIKILHYGLSSRLGGIETYLKKLAFLIDRNIFEFCFLIMGKEKPCFYQEFVDIGCSFYHITSRRDNFMKNFFELNHLFEIEQFDIVHCHLNSLSYITPALAAYNHGCKVIVHSHNAGLKARIAVKARHEINYYRLLKKDIMRIAVSDLAGKWMFGENVDFIVLNNGVDVSQFSYDEDAREQVRSAYHIADKEVIIHIGAFKVQKNHNFIIEVFNEYSKRHPESVLMLVGDGNLRTEIERLVISYGLSKQVIFTGQTEHISQLLSAADKFLFPSLYEGFPNALIEAECNGLFCVISDQITKQVCIDNLCTMVSLNASINQWVMELEKNHYTDRAKSIDCIMEKGLDTNSEMKMLSSIYKNLINLSEG